MDVLIVDDSSVIRERLAGLLSEIDGVRVVGEAETPGEALEAAERFNPDVVLLDIRLRGGNGVEVLPRIKKMVPAPVVIVITNYPYPQYRMVSMSMGADHFFHKTTELPDVITTIKNLAAARGFRGE